MKMQECIDADFMANWVRMGISGSDRAYVFFEGETDYRLFKFFFDETTCNLFALPAGAKGPGRAEVVRAMERLRGVDRAMAVVDADFWHATRTKPDLPNLFVTDTHDTETLIIRSGAFDKTLNAYCDLEKLRAFVVGQDKEHLRNVLLVSAQGVGFLRLASEAEGLSLPFSQIELDDFIDRKSLHIDYGALVGAISRNQQGRRIGKKALLERIEKGPESGHDPWHIVCGHDLVKVLAVGLREIFGYGEGHDPEELEHGLRQAFEREHFRETQLYKDIKRWSQNTLKREILSC